MISPSTLAAVRAGILTDTQLAEAFTHYSQLYENLNCHEHLYELVRRDVRDELLRLQEMKSARKIN